MSHQCFDSPKADTEIEKIIDYLRKVHSGTALQISEALGMRKNLVSDYLQHLRADEQVKVAEKLRGARSARVWMLGVDPAVLAALQPRRVVTKEWTPNMVRDVLVSALFGTPAQLQGVTA